MRAVRVDGSPESIAELTTALAGALDGGPAVLPYASEAVRDAMEPTLPAEPGTAVIIATSGSTGEPKGVLLSAAALAASANATHARLGGPGHWLLATPAQYIGGLQVLVRSLLAGTTPAVLSASGFRPDDFAEAAAPLLALDGPRYTALVPTQLGRLLDDAGPGLAAARAFDAIVIGAAATTADLRERAAEAGVKIVPAYGMSETASGCVYDGVPLDGVRIELDDERVCVAGDVLAHGYRLRPELTAEAFDGGRFRTSDRGRLGPDGRLEILGRIDDMINTGGVKVAAASVERVLIAQPGVRDACVVGVPDPEWGEAVVALVVGAGCDVDSLRAACREEAGAAAAPKRVEFTEELPLRGPGKVDRAAVRDLLLRS
ncbi:o-succinylbenzoate--CoA ligase [Amycolatopsis regifaucium]|uniref:AMP-dependent synthetase n=1 Tax=Amycolatopsis regifaucium TaxID=546365 RepID=A0A154MBG0_9PSEU|nr:o-succinylbenzoate--CoA ligase [Amycolatopsis regifaucium]KZB81915.1 AMP-dependent synthetase [Amycolatopsis regifaucium]OKA06014.1 AMP-dependent synthetase [Amycolatopsis regifaucium]SFG76423.1 O-succinylbenzoic acid--CoA ligase [Amycolatopsis regifaucium]